jgi:hypothetical protein
MVPRSEYYKPYSYWKVKMPAVKLIPRSDSRQIEEIAVAEPDLFCKTKEPRRLYDRRIRYRLFSVPPESLWEDCTSARWPGNSQPS